MQSVYHSGAVGDNYNPLKSSGLAVDMDNPTNNETDVYSNQLQSRAMSGHPNIKMMNTNDPEILSVGSKNMFGFQNNIGDASSVVGGGVIDGPLQSF